MPKQREYTIEERQTVVTLRNEGKTFREIQRSTGIPHTSSFNIFKKWTSKNTVQTLKRPGQKKKFTQPVVKAIARIIERDDEVVSKEIKDKLVKRFGGRFEKSERQVRNIRQQLGYTASKGIGQDVLTPQHKQERIRYCKRHQTDQFSNVVFTDEKPWILGKRRRKIWRKVGAAPRTYTKTKYPVKLQCWAGISLKGVTNIIIWKGRQKSQHYIKTLKSTLIPFAKNSLPKRWRMLHDRDTTHTSGLTNNWCDENIPITILCPAKSPDLNPIEKIWNTLEQKVYQHKPKTEDQLRYWIKKEWRQIDMKIVKNSIFSMMKNIPQIIAADGEYVESKRGFRH